MADPVNDPLSSCTANKFFAGIGCTVRFRISVASAIPHARGSGIRIVFYFRSIKQILLGARGSGYFPRASPQNVEGLRPLKGDRDSAGECYVLRYIVWYIRYRQQWIPCMQCSLGDTDDYDPRFFIRTNLTRTRHDAKNKAQSQLKLLGFLSRLFLPSVNLHSLANCHCSSGVVTSRFLAQPPRTQSPICRLYWRRLAAA